MKKLLSLLSVLTISGTAVPTTIAASPYQKYKVENNQEIDENIDFVPLKRTKRANDDLIENWYCFLCHNRLVVKISHDTWGKIYLNCKDRETIRDKYNYIYEVINNFEKRNSSGDHRSRYDFLNEDVEIIATVIAKHFWEINNFYKNKTNNNLGLLIRTNRDSYWESNSNFWGVNLNTEKSDYSNCNIGLSKGLKSGAATGAATGAISGATVGGASLAASIIAAAAFPPLAPVFITTGVVAATASTTGGAAVGAAGGAATGAIGAAAAECSK